jgi:predicted GH43/DUF377 family glycosyl hydrolase
MHDGGLLMLDSFTYSKEPALTAVPGCSWADTMILNPAIVKDPQSSALHMLFRATGPWAHKKLNGSKYDPYPIFLGYARSEDMGKTWQADFSRPALAPALEYDEDKIYVTDDEGRRVINYANGCVEDPRIFEVEGKLYVSVACRMFPPGPYWEDMVDPKGTHTNKPSWAKTLNNSIGAIACTNDTVSVLYRLNLDMLKNRQYEKAFTYVCNLTNGNVDDNRDVFLFPERMLIGGKMQYVLLHRPHNPENFKAGKGATRSSIMMAAAERIKDLATDKAVHQLVAVPRFDWEEERIGASWPPIKINDEEWLLAYHGKKYPGPGYTQSFMILRNQPNDFPKIIHRCSERLMYARQPWELPNKFECPCLFSTGGIVVDGTLIVSYGAADEKVGVSWVNFNELVDYIRNFDAEGRRVNQC